LRAYVGCATALFGDVSQADLIKLHKASGKATFLVYDDFEGKPLPELQHRIKVNLRTRWVQAFDHRADGQLLYFKERFVGAKHPRRADMEGFSVKLRMFGISDKSLIGPTKAGFALMLKNAGLNENLDKEECSAPRWPT
jgi:DNA phosphorothioation-associated putative methyltransferase